MTSSDDKTTKDLGQIRREQFKVLEIVEEIKRDADADAIADIERIEGEMTQVILDLDELIRRRDEQLAAEIEFNSTARRQRPNPNRRPEKCGRFYV